jgi:hypothetical protein
LIDRREERFIEYHRDFLLQRDHRDYIEDVPSSTDIISSLGPAGRHSQLGDGNPAFCLILQRRLLQFVTYFLFFFYATLFDFLREYSVEATTTEREYHTFFLKSIRREQRCTAIMSQRQLNFFAASTICASGRRSIIIRVKLRITAHRICEETAKLGAHVVISLLETVILMKSSFLQHTPNTSETTLRFALRNLN